MFSLPKLANFKVDLGNLETEFRAKTLPLDLEHTRSAIAFTVIAVSSLSSIDYLLYGISELFFLHLFVRGLFIVCSALAARLLLKETTFAAYERIVLIWGLALTILTVYVDYNRPPDFTQNATLHILMVFSGYILIPLRPSRRMVTPLLMTIGTLWNIITVKEIPSAAWLGVTVSAYLLLHIAGVITAVGSSNARRRQFLAEHELLAQNQRLRELAITDELTGIYNRRFFLERAREEFQLYLRHRRPLSLIIADLDLLKRINDTYGHHTGDAAIRQFAEFVSRQKRASDVLGRLGGEEFGLLLPDTRLAEAKIVAQRIFDTRDSLIIRTVEEDIRFTFTAGLAECRLEHQSLDDLFRVADLLLYRGKSKGRDCVEVDE